MRNQLTAHKPEVTAISKAFASLCQSLSHYSDQSQIGEELAAAQQKIDHYIGELEKANADLVFLNRELQALNEKLETANSRLISEIQRLENEQTNGSGSPLSPGLIEWRKTQQRLRILSEATSTKIGEEFLKSIVASLALLLNVRYVFICELKENDPELLQSVAFWSDKGFIESLDISVKDTPCGEILGQEPRLYPLAVQELFPDAHTLKEWEVQSYFGFPLFDSQGRALGILSIMDDKPMLPPFDSTEFIVRTMALRTEAEIERRRYLIKLNKSEQLYRTIARNFPNGNIALIDKTFTVLFIEGQELDRLGLTPADFLNKKIWELNPVEDLELLMSYYRRAFEGHAASFEAQIWGNCYDLSTVPLPDENGEIRQIMLVTLNITERKKAEEKIRESERALKEAQRLARLGSWEYYPDTQLLKCSEEMYSIYGYAISEKLTVDLLFQRRTDADTPVTLQQLLEAIRRGEAFSYDTRIKLPDQTLKFIQVMGKPCFDDEHRLLKLQGTVMDITDRKQAEEQIRKSEQLLQEIFDNSADALFLINPENQLIEDCNQVALSLFAIPDKKAVLGTGVYDFQKRPFMPDEIEETTLQFMGNGDWSGEVKYHTMDGREFWGHLAVKALKIQDRDLQLLRISNIDARKHAELKLQESYKMLADFRAALDASSIVAITNTEGIITYVNENFCLISGYSNEEIVGQTHRLLKSEQHPQAFFDELWSTISSGRIWRGEMRNRAKDGGLYWELCTIIPFLDENGRPLQYLSVASDITTRKEAEEELLKSKQKAEEMNRLKSSFLANMSHEIRTPLNGILGVAEIISMESSEDEIKGYAGLIKESGDRLLHTINAILDLSKIEARQTELRLKKSEVTCIVDKIAKLLKVLADKKGLEMIIVHQAAELHVLIDESLFGQILNNLIGNAIKFTDAGSITITTGKIKREGSREMVSIQVTDTGIGITNEYISALFTPFMQVSTGHGRKYQGTGLGLSISKSFAEIMGGSITATSEKGKGSTFEVVFPLAGEE